MIKRFFEWILVKNQLDDKAISAPYVNEGDVWWSSIGENVGFEINGKSKLFTRPVVIVKKFTYGFYLVAPTTSQERKGTWYVNFPLSSLVKTVCLHQIRTIDYRRLFSKLGRLDEVDFRELKRSFLRLYQ